MIVNMYSVHDAAAQAYLPPFYFLHDNQAIRTFTDCINSEKHQFSHHPDDYTLYKIGTFDDDGASIGNIAPISLGNGINFVKSKSERYAEEIIREEISNGPPILKSTDG